MQSLEMDTECVLDFFGAKKDTHTLWGMDTDGKNITEPFLWLFLEVWTRCVLWLAVSSFKGCFFVKTMGWSFIEPHLSSTLQSCFAQTPSANAPMVTRASRLCHVRRSTHPIGGWFFTTWFLLGVFAGGWLHNPAAPKVWLKLKPFESWDKPAINWCRISPIHSIF